jgi:hypothetical protein
MARETAMVRSYTQISTGIESSAGSLRPFVLGKIDETLSWEKTKEQEKNTRFVELGEVFV